MAVGTVIHGEDAGSGSGMGWDGQVEFRGDLPITIGIPPVGSIYLVEKPTTILGITIYQSGLYMRDLDNGNLSDWRRLNVKVTFQDNEFMLVKASDNSAKSRFDLSLVSASQTRVLTLQDKDGTIALLSDLSGHGLPTVLGIDNTTGANDIIISALQEIIGDGTNNSFINLKQAGNDDTIKIGTSKLLVPRTELSLTNGFAFLTSGNFNIGSHYAYITVGSGAVPQANYVQANLLKNPFSIWGRYGMEQNDLNSINSFNFPSYPFWASAQDGTIAQDVINSLLLGGDGQNLTKDNTVAVPDLQIQDGKVIHPETGDVIVNLRAFGVDGEFLVTNDGAEDYSMGWLDMHPVYSALGFNLVTVTMDANIIQMTTNYLNNTDMSRFTLLGNSMFFQVIDNSTGRTSLFGATNNTVADFIDFPRDNMPFYMGTSGVTIKLNVVNSVALGGINLIVKTNNTAYVQQLAFNWNDNPFETVINATVPTADRTQTLQDADGIIALTTDIGLGALKQKSGQELGGTFAGNPKKVTVTFATPFADANYSVSVIGQGGDNRTWTIETKLAGSFVINANANPVLANPVLWTAIKHGEN